MRTKTTERRCISCHKILIDERLPFCRRCVLEGRNKAGEVIGIGGGTLMTVIIAKAMANNLDHHSNDDDNKEV